MNGSTTIHTLRIVPDGTGKHFEANNNNSFLSLSVNNSNVHMVVDGDFSLGGGEKHDCGIVSVES